MDVFNYQTLYEYLKRLQRIPPEQAAVAGFILMETARLTDTPQVSLFTFQADQIDEIYVLGAQSQGRSAHPQRASWERLWRQGLIGYVYHGRRPILIRNLAHDARWPQSDDAILPRAGSALAAPLIANHGVIGVLLLLCPRTDQLNETLLSFVNEISIISAPGLANALRKPTPHTAFGSSQYHTIFTEMPIPVLLTTEDNTILDANHRACDLLGFERGTLAGVPLQDVNIDAQAQQTQLADANLDEFRFRSTIYNVDGQMIPVQVRVRRILIEGEPAREWSLHDLSAEVELEKLRRDLTDMLFHDLRSPLTMIRLGVSHMKRSLQKYGPVRSPQIVDNTLRAVAQLEHMISSLLDIQQLENGQDILDTQPTLIALLVNEVVAALRPVAQQHNQRLRFQAADNLPLLHVDQSLINRVVVNLIENAIKYTPAGGEIMVEVKQAGDQLWVSTTDSGPGIPHEMQTEIFDKFSRVRYKNAPLGAGMGLAFCRLAVEAHDGQIWVESDGETGSRFVIALPVGRSHSEKDEAGPSGVADSA